MEVRVIDVTDSKSLQIHHAGRVVGTAIKAISPKKRVLKPDPPAPFQHLIKRALESEYCINNGSAIKLDRAEKAGDGKTYSVIGATVHSPDGLVGCVEPKNPVESSAPRSQSCPKCGKEMEEGATVYWCMNPDCVMRWISKTELKAEIYCDPKEVVLQ